MERGSSVGAILQRRGRWWGIVHVSLLVRKRTPRGNLLAFWGHDFPLTALEHSVCLHPEMTEGHCDTPPGVRRGRDWMTPSCASCFGGPCRERCSSLSFFPLTSCVSESVPTRRGRPLALTMNKTGRSKRLALPSSDGMLQHGIPRDRSFNGPSFWHSLLAMREEDWPFRGGPSPLLLHLLPLSVAFCPLSLGGEERVHVRK